MCDYQHYVCQCEKVCIAIKRILHHFNVNKFNLKLPSWSCALESASLPLPAQEGKVRVVQFVVDGVLGDVLIIKNNINTLKRMTKYKTGYLYDRSPS